MGLMGFMEVVGMSVAAAKTGDLKKKKIKCIESKKKIVAIKIPTNTLMGTKSING